MNRQVEVMLDYVDNNILKDSMVAKPLNTLRQFQLTQLFTGTIIPIIIGLILGFTMSYTRDLPRDWAGLIVLATLAPAVVLFINNVRQVLLFAFTIDIPLGLDVMLAEQVGHRGGPSGYVVSLMTMALVVGYGLWVTEKSLGLRRKLVFQKGITVPGLLFIFLMLISIFQASNIRVSFTQLFLEIQFFLMYFYLINHISKWFHVRLVYTVLTIGFLLQSLLMTLQYFTGFQLAGFGVASNASASNIASSASRVAGTLGSPNAAATYLAATLAIVFGAYLAGNILVDKRLTFISFILGIISLLGTQSRSGWLAFAVALLIISFQAIRRRIGTQAIFLIFVLGILIGSGFSVQIKERFTTDDNGSAETRLYHTEWAFNILADHNMFTGVGLNNMWFLAVERRYLPLELMSRKHLNILHNKYLMVWVETGLFGFLSFLWLLFAGAGKALFSALRAKDPRISLAIMGLFGAMIVYIWHMSSDPFGARIRMQYLWFILALIVTLSRFSNTLIDPDETATTRKDALL